MIEWFCTSLCSPRLALYWLSDSTLKHCCCSSKLHSQWPSTEPSLQSERIPHLKRERQWDTDRINWKLQTSKSKLTGRREHTNHSKGLSLPDRKGNRCACHTLPQASSPPDHTAQQEKSLIHTSHSDDPPFSLQAYGWVSLLTTHIKYALLHFLY